MVPAVAPHQGWQGTAQEFMSLCAAPAVVTCSLSVTVRRTSVGNTVVVDPRVVMLYSMCVVLADLWVKGLRDKLALIGKV